MRFEIQVTDYEHSGDIDLEINYIKSICSEASDFNSTVAVDNEAEDEYIREYGELDEHIYEAYVYFNAPASKEELLREIGCRRIYK